MNSELFTHSFCRESLTMISPRILNSQVLTRPLSEEKTANFSRVDHSWPHKAGDCVCSLGHDSIPEDTTQDRIPPEKRCDDGLPPGPWRIVAASSQPHEWTSPHFI